MKRLILKLRDPATYAGAAVAAASFNWASIVPMGSQTWWFSVFAVVGGVLATVLKPPA